MKSYIYVLKLEKNKYYIGFTYGINNIPEDHFNNDGTYWTKKYKPLNIYHIYKNKSICDLDDIVFKYMKNYGVENVRGGSINSIIISMNDEILLKKHNIYKI